VKVLDFGVLPPEINSGRMYSGPGSESMLAAASAWEALAAELRSAAVSYSSVVTRLTSESWRGPSSERMAAAATSYSVWMITTAEQAEESATREKAAVAAYEAAFAATVPPPVITANRARLMALAASNVFGQNSPAIAATEAQYAEMWAQDAAAMYGYAGASSAASAVTPFTPPPQTTTLVGVASQATAITQASDTPAAAAVQTTASAMTSQLTYAATVPQLLQQLASASAASTAGSPFASLLSYLNLGKGAWGLGLATSNLTTVLKQTLTGYFPTGIASFVVGIEQQLTFGPGGSTAGTGGAWYPTPQFAGLGGWGGPAPVSASVGQGGTIGRLSVPPSWATGAPQALGSATPGLLNGHAAYVHPSTSGLLRGLPLAGTGVSRRAASGLIHRYGFRHAVMPRPPSAG
jgi:PPE-repeat protein